MSAKRPVDLRTFYPMDLFGYANQLTDDEINVLVRLRHYLEAEVKPIVNEYWEKAEFPFQIIDGYVKTEAFTDPVLFVNSQHKYKPREVFSFFRAFEMAKVDASITTFMGVHGGLFFNTILALGSEEQVERWAKPTMNFEIQGCFALTEPEHGSDISGGLGTTAEKVGDQWIINGEKRWIGGANTADEMAVFARDKADGQVKAFVVPGKSEGIEVEVIDQKIALRMVQNGHITFTNVKVDADRYLEKSHSFKDVSKVLGITRSEVGHMAAGITAGAFEAAQKYVANRVQFGKPLASFQLVQEKLAIMQANVTATMGYSMGLANLQDQGIFNDANSSITKMHNSLRMRETVALAREVCGGNGIVLENDVARFFADGEAIYSYEGTHEMNALIVGRQLTRIPAFI